MPDIVLTTLNAKFAHSSFGLRYLQANLGELAGVSEIVEFEISQRPIDILETLVALRPQIVGLGVYIWNVDQATRLVCDLKQICPKVTVILGGPEVSYESEVQAIVQAADYVITGEADITFAKVCHDVLNGRPPAQKIIAAELPKFDQLSLPYHLYSDHDIAHRVIYVEASRGCPFSCEFCLSALDIPVRQSGLEKFLAEMDMLLARGVLQFKFVDRTFNLNLSVGKAILEFFYARLRDGLFLHFEMIPDRLPDALRSAIAKFPPGVLQFEVGIQTFDDHICELISRRQDIQKVDENLTWLHNETGVHVHADLIVGLPGADINTVARDFDHLVALKPQEIQVGILKRLRGTPIIRHDVEWEMLYSSYAPYEILQTRLIDFPTMQRLRRFARYWDLVANSGNFLETTCWIWRLESPFWSFLEWSDWLFHRSRRTNGIALGQLSEYLFQFLTEVRGLPARDVAQPLWRDYQRGGRNDRPPFLRDHIDAPMPSREKLQNRHLPKRQAKHIDNTSTKSSMFPVSPEVNPPSIDD